VSKEKIQEKVVMSTRVLVVVPCGKGKIWDMFPKRKATRAEEAYTGAPFKVNKAFAQKFADKWVILSAKYGFIEPSFSIPENYNVSFNDTATNPIDPSELKIQMKKKGLANYNVVIALGGKNYTKIVKEIFVGYAKVIAPTEGLPIGKAMKLVKFLTNLDKEEMLKKIG
jgi:hypothetical protein